MAPSLYRDPLAGLRAKRAAVDALEGGMHPLLWSLCSSSDRAEIAHLREQSFGADSAEANEALDSLASRLEAVRGARERLVCGRTVEEPSEWIEPAVGDDGLFASLRDGLDRALSPWALRGPVERLGKRRLRARFDATFVPLMLTVRLDVGETWVDDIPYLGAYAYECRLRTTVPACLPDLELSAERLWHTVEKAVGLAREPQLGDVPFDRAFWVRGDPNVARGLLVPEVREELLCLGWRKPHLLLESGSLDVAWWGESDRVHTGDLASSVRAAVATVLGMRAVIDRVGAGSR